MFPPGQFYKFFRAAVQNAHDGKTACPAPQAFSLIELLVVIGIIALLAAGSIPVLNSMRQARTITDSAYQFTALIESARNEAIARRSFVWLGLEPVASPGGGRDVLAGLAYSRDGTTNSGSSNLQPLGRTQRFENLDLFPPSVAPGTPTDLTTQNPGINLQIGPKTFSRFILTFTPMGEVTLVPAPGPQTGFEPQVGFGLRAMRGLVPDNNNPLDIVISGSTGLPTIHRP
jgi:prepilin-type N-terminal cleavage/methylation domain-containing protein